MTRKIIVWAVLALSLFAGEAYAAVGGAPLPKNAQPVLITYLGGVSPEMRERAEQAMKNHGGHLRLKGRNENGTNGRTVMAKPQASDLAAGGYKTLVVMVGSYMEPGANPGQDSKRLEKLLNEAMIMHTRVVLVHLERPVQPVATSTLDVGRVDLLLKYANHVVVMKSGDAINARMTAYAKQNNVALSILDSPRDMMPNGNAQYRGHLRMRQAQ